MEELEEYKQNLIQNITNLQNLINKSPLFHTDREKWQTQVKNLSKDIKKNILILEEEVKELSSSQASHYVGSIKSFKKKIEKIENDYIKRGKDNSISEGDRNSIKEEQRMAPIYEVFKRGDQAQQMTKTSVKEMNIMVERGIQMANDINLELNKQIQQLDRMQEGTKDAESTLKRAQKNIVYFARALDCDMCMVGLLLLILLALVGVIVLAIKNKSQ